MAEFDPDSYLDKKRAKQFDPDEYIARQASDSLITQFGRTAASTADVALNAVTGTLDWGAYNLARAAGRSPEQARAETTSPKDIIGRAFGVEQTPEYQSEASRRIMGNIGETISENVVQPLSTATGAAPADVESILGSATLAAGPAVNRAVGATGRGAATTARGARDVVGGAYSTLTGKTAAPGAVPKPWQQPSSRVPVGESWYTPQSLEAWRQGRIPTSAVESKLVSELPQSALATTGGTVPYRGQGLRAVGESIGETYRNPINVLTDVGLDVLTGSPLPTMARLGYKAVKGAKNVRAAKKLEGLGFTPISPEELQALQTNQNIYGYQAGGAATAGASTQPLLPYTPAGTSPIAQPGPGRRVNIEGESFNLPYEIDLSQVNTARAPQQSAASMAANRPQPATAQESIQAQVQAAAAERAGVPVTSKNPADILAQIRARGAQQAQQYYRPPVGEPPIASAGPVAPADLPAAPVAKPTTAPVAPDAPVAQDPVAQRLSQLRQNENPLQTEMTTQAVEQRNQRLAERREKMEPMYQMKRDVKQTAMAGVTKKNNRIVVDRTVFDDMAPEGVTIDWDKQPSMSALSLPEARKTIRKFIEDELRKTPETTKPDLPENLFSTGAAPKNTLGMIVPEGKTITTRGMPEGMQKAMNTPEGTAALLKGEGRVIADGIEYRVERISTGELRIQARKNGQVIDEFYPGT